MTSLNTKIIYNSSQFEKCVSEIFREAGFQIVQNEPLDNNRGDIDIVAENDNGIYVVEVKYSQISPKVSQRINEVAKLYKAIPIIVTAQRIDEQRRVKYCEQYPDLILIDVANLLFAVQYNVELRNNLISILPYSIDNITPEENFLRIDTLQHDDHAKSLIEEMQSCLAGNATARQYEVICKKMLENIFSDDLALWREQQRSNNDLYRFDLLCRIKDGNQKTFWSILERYFNSKYIIFEFKNYTRKITQKEIYTTEKYLYSKALRSVGIIISANGYDENAYWAAKGCLRENGKLILLLDTNDLIHMNKMKINQDDPAEFLLDKLDALLLDLEK